MSFSNPWGLLALLSLPTIFAIHLFLQRFKRHEVAGLFLWAPERRKALPGRRREPPRVSVSLILELLAAALLSFLLAGPRFGEALEVRHAVFVLDTSASMSAVHASGRTARDVAIENVRDVLEDLGRYGRATLILTGRKARILAGPAVVWHEAADRLTEWSCWRTRHDPDDALGLARRLAADTGELYLATDRLPGAAPRDVTVIAVGEKRPNVGFVGANRSRAPGKESGKVFLRIENFSDRKARTILTIHAGQTEITRKGLILSPGGRTLIEQEIPAAIPEVRAMLSDDALALDNAVVLMAPPARTVAVANLMPGGRERERIASALAAVQGIAHVAESARAHLVIAPAMRATEITTGYVRLGIGPIPLARQATAKPDKPQEGFKTFVGPFVGERTHPLLDGVALNGVIWGGAAPYRRMATPVLSAGDIPLIFSPRTARGCTFILNLDLTRSNLHRSPDWPILISNAVEIARSHLPGLARRNFRIGEQVRFRLAKVAAGKYALRSGDKKAKLAPIGDQLIMEPDLGVGPHEVMKDEETLAKFSVNFLDESESDLRSLDSGRISAAAEGRLVTLREESASIPGLLLLCALVGFLLMNWWFLQRQRVH